MKKVRLAPFIEEKLTKLGTRSWGRYTFLPTDRDGFVVESEVSVPGGFVAIATAGEGMGLALHSSNETLVYRFMGRDVELFAEDEADLIAHLDRDELWESIEENMPAERPYFLGIMLQAHQRGALQTLAFDVPGDRENLFVYRGMVQIDEMLQDGLDRELKHSFGIDDFKVLDLFDEDAFVLQEDGERIPLFTVKVEVEYFEPSTLGLNVPLKWIREESLLS